MKNTTIQEVADQNPQVTCEDCARKHKIYSVRLSLGLAESLRLVGETIAASKINCLHVSKKSKMLHNSICNLSKLCQHGLLAHADEAYIKKHLPESTGVAGYYLLTKKGAAFLRGEAVPVNAIVLHNKNYGYYLSEGMVTIHELKLEPYNNPYFDTIETMEKVTVYPDGRLL